MVISAVSWFNDLCASYLDTSITLLLCSIEMVHSFNLSVRLFFWGSDLCPSSLSTFEYRDSTHATAPRDLAPYL